MEWPAPTELISLSPQLVWLHHSYAEGPLARLQKNPGIHEPKLNGDLLIIYKNIDVSLSACSSHCSSWPAVCSDAGELFFNREHIWPVSFGAVELTGLRRTVFPLVQLLFEELT